MTHLYATAGITDIKCRKSDNMIRKVAVRKFLFEQGYTIVQIAEFEQSLGMGTDRRKIYNSINRTKFTQPQQALLDRINARFNPPVSRFFMPRIIGNASNIVYDELDQCAEQCD